MNNKYSLELNHNDTTTENHSTVGSVLKTACTKLAYVLLACLIIALNLGCIVAAFWYPIGPGKIVDRFLVDQFGTGSLLLCITGLLHHGLVFILTMFLPIATFGYLESKGGYYDDDDDDDDNLLSLSNPANPLSPMNPINMMDQNRH